jgi:hypothetical protein
MDHLPSFPSKISTPGVKTLEGVATGVVHLCRTSVATDARPLQTAGQTGGQT